MSFHRVFNYLVGLAAGWLLFQQSLLKFAEGLYVKAECLLLA